MSTADFFLEARARYEAACSRRDGIEAEWVALGEPLLERGSTGQLKEHPLVKMLREHDLLLRQLGEQLRVQHRGPQPSAVLKAVGGLPPPLELKQARRR